jgi:hypothetical protein
MTREMESMFEGLEGAFGAVMALRLSADRLRESPLTVHEGNKLFEAMTDQANEIQRTHAAVLRSIKKGSHADGN